MAALALAAILSGFVLLYRYENIDISDYAFAATLTIALSASIFNWCGLYDAQQDMSLKSQLRYLLVGTSVSILVLIVALFLFKSSTEYSRAWVVGWWAGGIPAISLGRVMLDRIKARWVIQGRLRKNVAVIGAGDQGSRVVTALLETGNRHFNVVGIFDDRHAQLPNQFAGVPVRGTVADLLTTYKSGVPIDEVIVALPRSANTQIGEIVRLLHPLPIDVSLSLEDERRINYKSTRRIGRLTVLDILERPLSDWRYTIKTIEDKFLGAIILAVISPILLLIAIGVKIDTPGPVFFRQKRYGWCLELIEVYKFRTMFAADADSLGENLTQRADPRITTFGRFLRRFSLDELPQFINVLKGEMSIVGPRPHPVSAKAGDKLYQEAVANYALRHRVKPGITGWAQINGLRGETDTLDKIQKRVEHDLFYIENWSLLFDLEIIGSTVLQMFRKDAAF